MDYKKDSAHNEYLQLPLGWDSPEFNLRITFVSENETVRMNKSDGKNHIYPGPEFDLQHIPKLIEALAKIYNDNTKNR
jgi:hypothetical protein